MALQNYMQEFFKTAHNNFQHVFNHIVNFQSKWTTNAEITVVVMSCQMLDVYGMRTVWYTAEKKMCLLGLSRQGVKLLGLGCQIAIIITI